MDVADTHFGIRGKDRDEYALQVQAVFKRFLEEYSGEDAQELFAQERETLFIDFKDVEHFDINLAEDLLEDYFRFYPYLCQAVGLFVRDQKIRQAESLIDPTNNAERLLIRKELEQSQLKSKNYYVGFYNVVNFEHLRNLSSTRIGTLTRVSGQVVRTHSVHPELIIGHFTCDDCLTEQYTKQQFRYTQPSLCANDNCNNRTRFRLNLQHSRFTDFQRIRIQETQQELPRGCIPRSFDVIIRGVDQVECIQPGDQCDFIGTLIAAPDVGQMMSGVMGTVANELSGESGVTGLKSLGVKEMTHSLAFLANACIRDGQEKPCIATDDAKDNDMQGLDVKDFTQEEKRQIEEMSKNPNLLNNLSESLFSSIYGSEDVKRGIILQLLGGVAKKTSTGTKLRGDINICLVGDPSTAKSQFLKIVTDCAPLKAVYTSGKASSASGLTAAVVRDSDSGFVIEAGALMLADRGICCIDEFDKMDLKDQVAIHEAMEQQTISITKAGVSATLNARASILAAANPIGGRYDVSRDLRSNVNFSLPIMSRFDLFFVLIDPRQNDNDRLIAARILNMHRTLADPKENEKNMKYTFEQIKLYLRFARKFRPKIPAEAEIEFVKEYNRLRVHSKESRKAWRITVRQLESLIRLSEAIARAHCDEVVKPEYITLASRLIEKTQVQVGQAEVDLDDVRLPQPEDLLSGGDLPPAPLDTNGQSQGMYEGELESQRLAPSQTTKEISSSLKVEVYKSIAELLVRRLKREEEVLDKEVPSLKVSELVDWYLHQCIAEIETESELVSKKLLCEKVIDRLVNKEEILLKIRDDGGILSNESEDEDPMIIVNPHLDVAEFFD